MKVLVVDIDGPLATDECAGTKVSTKWGRLYKMNPHCVKVLNEIIEETGAEIILSSDWRLHFTLEEIGEIFEWNEIVKKPFAFTGIESVSFSNLERNRIHQIKQSLEEYKPEKWVVFDDLCLGLQQYNYGLTNFVFIDPINGLAADGIKEQILNYLN